VSVRDHQRGPFHASGFELPEEDAPGVFRLVEHRLHRQDLPGAGRLDAAGDHHRHRDDASFNSDLLIQGINPEEGILLGQGPGLEVNHLRVELLVELRDLGGGDVLDAHGLGQALDLPGRDPVDEGLLDDRDQGLFRSPSFRDEERHIAALADLGHQQINRPHPSIDSPGPSSREVSRAL
jgi:hypothetical protein